MEDDQIRVATAEEGYDRQDPQGIPVFAFAGVIVVTLLASFLFVTYYYGVVTDGQIQAAVGNVGARDLGEVRASEEPVLTRYRFADKAKGKVSLPVDRAMELLEQEANAGILFYPAKPTPVKTAADLAGPGGAVAAPGAPGPVAESAGASAAGAPMAAPAATPVTGEHGKK